MKKVIRLTESDLKNIINRVINEENLGKLQCIDSLERGRATTKSITSNPQQVTVKKTNGWLHIFHPDGTWELYDSYNKHFTGQWRCVGSGYGVWGNFTATNTYYDSQSESFIKPTQSLGTFDLIQSNKQFSTANAPSDYLGKGGEFERYEASRRGFNSCLPGSLPVFGAYIQKNKKKLMGDLQVDENTLLLMSKAAMGIIGRETSFGKGTDFGDDAAEFLTNWGLGFIPQGLQGGYNMARSLQGKDKRQMSLGPAQFTKDTWNSYGLDKKIGPYDESFNTLNQGLGALYRINQDYQLALKTGTGTGPSVNPIAVKQGKIKSINGTGNNALDLSIVAHNMAGLIKKWCQTSSPNYAGPCDQSIYQPFKDSKPEEKYTVYKDKQILNYFPNKKSGNLTSIGYLEEVTKYIKELECFKI